MPETEMICYFCGAVTNEVFVINGYLGTYDACANCFYYDEDDEFEDEVDDNEF